MKNIRKLTIIILSCFITILVVIALIVHHNRKYPSVIDDSYSVVSGVDFSANLEKKNSLICTVVNHNDYKIYYGANYCLEKEIDGKWYELADTNGKRAGNRPTNALAYAISANEHKELVISLDIYWKLTDGKYRIIIFTGTEAPSKDILVANFKVGN